MSIRARRAAFLALPRQGKGSAYDPDRTSCFEVFTRLRRAGVPFSVNALVDLDHPKYRGAFQVKLKPKHVAFALEFAAKHFGPTPGAFDFVTDSAISRHGPPVFGRRLQGGGDKYCYQLDGRFGLDVAERVDRGFRQAIETRLKLWKTDAGCPAPSSTEDKVNRILQAVLRQIDTIHVNLKRHFQFAPCYDHLFCYFRGGSTEQHADAGLQLEIPFFGASRAICVSAPRPFELFVGNKGTFKKDGAGVRSMGMAWGSLYAGPSILGGTNVLDAHVLDFKEDNPDSPAHAAAAEVCMQHAANRKRARDLIHWQPGISIMSTGKGMI